MYIYYFRKLQRSIRARFGTKRSSSGEAGFSTSVRFCVPSHEWCSPSIVFQTIRSCFFETISMSPRGAARACTIPPYSEKSHDGMHIKWQHPIVPPPVGQALVVRGRMDLYYQPIRDLWCLAHVQIECFGGTWKSRSFPPETFLSHEYNQTLINETSRICGIQFYVGACLAKHLSVFEY